MTRTRTLLTALLVALLLVGTATAVSTPRSQPTDTSPPVRVFVGETLDVSAVELTGGGTVGSGSVTLVGLAGDADGTTESIDDPTDADFGGFETGSYDVAADGDDRADVVVVEPRVTSVVVRNQNDANVTDGWDPSGDDLTLTVEYNFDEADRVDVTVESPDGLDVTPRVAAVDRITESGGSITLDLSDEPVGTFEITVEGSDLDRASQTVTVRTGPRGTATPLPTATETETATPTPVPATPTDTPTATETQPITATPTDTPTATTSPTTSPPTATETQPATPTETASPTPQSTTSTSTPGFGVWTVLLALVTLSALALGRHR
jgi:hypothetical protein